MVYKSMPKEFKRRTVTVAALLRKIGNRSEIVNSRFLKSNKNSKPAVIEINHTSQLISEKTLRL